MSVHPKARTLLITILLAIGIASYSCLVTSHAFCGSDGDSSVAPPQYWLTNGISRSSTSPDGALVNAIGVNVPMARSSRKPPMSENAPAAVSNWHVIRHLDPATNEPVPPTSGLIIAIPGPGVGTGTTAVDGVVSLPGRACTQIVLVAGVVRCSATTHVPYNPTPPTNVLRRNGVLHAAVRSLNTAGVAAGVRSS